MNQGKLDVKKRIVKYTWLYYLVSIIVFFVYVELLRLFLPILVGDEFRGAMDYIPLIALGYTMFGMYRVIASFLYFQNRTGILALVTTFAAAMNAA